MKTSPKFLNVFLLLAAMLVCACLFGMPQSVCCAAPVQADTTAEEQFEPVVLEFCYKGKIWRWDDKKLAGKTKIFTHSAQAQKHGKLGSHLQRSALVKRVHALGFSWEDSFDYTFFGLRELVDEICRTIDIQMLDATLTFDPQTKPWFHFTNERTGYLVEKERLYQKLWETLKEKPQLRIDIQPKVIKPQITRAYLEKFQNMRASFETNYQTSNANRKSNIKRSISEFNGLVIQPDTVYSFNTITGRRSTEKGYREANIIVNGEYVEAPGGGVCQSSTTLYNSLLLAGLEIVEVHPHTLVSNYVLNGFDAMVNFGSSDLKWKNTSGEPMYVRTYANGEVVGVEVFGRAKPGELKIKRSSMVLEKISPPADRVVEDAGLFEDEKSYQTYPKEGCVVNSYLEFWKDGTLFTKKLIRQQKYKPVQGVLLKGTKIRPQMPQPEIFYDNNQNFIDYFKGY